MSTVSTVVNVNPDSCPGTTGVFNVRAFYTETDNGHIFGTFTTRERAEECVLVLAARSNVVKAQVEVV